MCNKVMNFIRILGLEMGKALLILEMVLHFVELVKYKMEKYRGIIGQFIKFMFPFSLVLQKLQILKEPKKLAGRLMTILN